MELEWIVQNTPTTVLMAMGRGQRKLFFLEQVDNKATTFLQFMLDEAISDVYATTLLIQTKIEHTLPKLILWPLDALSMVRFDDLRSKKVLKSWIIFGLSLVSIYIKVQKIFHNNN